jgi:hypothetical protein
MENIGRSSAAEEIRQPLNDSRGRVGDHRDTIRMMTAAGAGRVANVVEGRDRGGHGLDETPCEGLERLMAARREGQHVGSGAGGLLLPRARRRRFLDDQVGVGAAETE